MKKTTLYLIAVLALMFIVSGCSVGKKETAPVAEKQVTAPPAPAEQPTVRPEEKPVVAEEVIPDKVKNENSDIDTIRAYYRHLSFSDLDKAYAMYADKKVSFDKYTEWYENVSMAHPYEFETQVENRYKFFVDLTENKKTDKYQVVMEVEDEKITTLSSELLYDEEAIFGNMRAYAKKRFDKNMMVLVKDGQETIIEEASDDYMENFNRFMRFGKPRFSETGRYLIYVGYGWEWTVGRVYDIKEGKIAIKLNYMVTNSNASNFLLGEKYFYSCGHSDLGGLHYAEIFGTSDFEIIYDYEQRNKDVWYTNMVCEFDAARNVLRMSSVGTYVPTGGVSPGEKEVVEYDFDTKTSKIIK